MSENANSYLCEVEALEEEKRLSVTVNGRCINVIAIGDEYYALSNYCPHQGGPMCDGAVSGAIVSDDDFKLEYTRDDEIMSCPWHGWEFDIKSGDHLAPTGYSLYTYDIKVVDGSIYLGE